MKKILLLLVVLVVSFVSLVAFSPIIFSDKANAVPCGTRNAAGCEQYGPCPDPINFTCTQVSACSYSCIAKVFCDGVCQNSACGPAGAGTGSCSTGLICCARATVPNSCTSTDCFSNGSPGCPTGYVCSGTKTATTSNCACIGGGGGTGTGTAPPPPAQYPVGDPSACIGEGKPCTPGGAYYGAKVCCPPLICKREAGPDTGVGCYPPRQAIISSNCNNGVSCDTALGPISTDGAGFVKALFRVLLGISGGIAAILIIISGYRLMTSQGNPEKVQLAKEQLTAAIVGLLFIIFSLAILQTIGVNILQLPGFGT